MATIHDRMVNIARLWVDAFNSIQHPTQVTIDMLVDLRNQAEEVIDQIERQLEREAG